jgi:hypothetical protein
MNAHPSTVLYVYRVPCSFNLSRPVHLSTFDAGSVSAELLFTLYMTDLAASGLVLLYIYSICGPEVAFLTVDLLYRRWASKVVTIGAARVYRPIKVRRGRAARQK